MFDEELFLARRYMVPWRFRRNKKLSSRWELTYQKFLFEELLVALEERDKHQYMVVEPSYATKSIKDKCISESSIKNQAVVETTIVSNGNKNSASTPVNDILCSPKSLMETEKKNFPSTVHNMQVMLDVNTEIGLTEKEPHLFGTNISSKKKRGRSDLIIQDKKIRKYEYTNSDLQKRIDEITKIYANSHSLSQLVKIKLLKRLHDLKVKIKQDDHINSVILSLRSRN
ncbi:hypothetical protein Btru_054245 [Bulinus truncatus]|nr:hypothetical protein Btru_054245 [Bulinus truncatus]